MGQGRQEKVATSLAGTVSEEISASLAPVDAELERVIKELDARGISLLARLHAGDVDKTTTLPLRIAKIQKKLGLRVCVEGCGADSFDGELCVCPPGRVTTSPP